MRHSEGGGGSVRVYTVKQWRFSCICMDITLGLVNASNNGPLDICWLYDACLDHEADDKFFVLSSIFHLLFEVKVVI